MKRQSIDPPKHPEETLEYEVDFSTAIASGDSLSGAYSVAVTDQSNGVEQASMVSGAASRTGTAVAAFITGGSSGKKYEIKYKTATAGGETLVEILVLKVSE